VPRAPIESALPAVCTACGCLCDDIEISIHDDRVTEALYACPIGREWFLQSREEPVPSARIDGKPVEILAAIDHAIRLLTDARCPLVYGLSKASCEAQLLALDIALKLRAVLDIDRPVGRQIAAARRRGMRKCSLADLRHRADLIMIWQANPLLTHPRYFERYIGRDRIVMAVGERSFTSEAVQHFLKVPPVRALDFLRLTLAALRHVPSSDSLVAAAGFDPGELRALVDRMRSCRFGVMLFDAQLIDAEELDAIFALVTELDRATHWASLSLGCGGNATGALNVISSRTGQPPPLSFVDGTPHHQADLSGPLMLERGEVDALLLISPHRDTLTALPIKNLPTVIVHHDDGTMFESADVAIVAATPGLDAPGTFHRADDVPLRLGKVRNSTRPSDEEVLGMFLERLSAFCR
jgi:formylmethanofuran dehydrogenase subunit B